MKSTILRLATIAMLPVLLLLNGCIAIGNRDAQRPSATLGQQLIDLQKARDAGAITEPEYQAQKARLLETK